MKIKCNLDVDLPLKKTLKLHKAVIAVRFAFHEDSKYYQQAFSDEGLYKLKTLEYDMIDISEGIDINNTNDSRKCIICYCLYFLEINIRFQPNVRNGCHDLTQEDTSFKDVSIVPVK